MHKRVLISLMWFHSILLERRKFKTQGLNIPYDFNISDFFVSYDLITLIFNEDQCDISLKGLQHLIGDALYGGKVTDEWDMRLLQVYLQELFSEDIMQQDRMKPCILPQYWIKHDITMSAFESFISTLPSMDNPAIFGQHPNAEYFSQVEEVNDFLSNFSKMKIKTEAVLHTMQQKGLNSFVFEVLERIPLPFNEDQLKNVYGEPDSKDAMRIFLRQEIHGYNCMLKLIHSSKEDIKNFTKGYLSPSLQLERVVNDLSQFKVPMEWSQYYDSTMSLDSWTNDLCKRIEQLTKWLEEGEPKTIWLGGFMRPSSFLTSILQMHARSKFTGAFQMNTKTSWEFQVLKTDETVSEKPEDGVFISGMFLEGAMWKDDDGVGHLVEQLPMKSRSPMPIIHFKPTESRKRANEEEVYHCPVYSYPGRVSSTMNSSFVLAIDLNNGGKSANHWTKRGVALLLSTSQ